jgi:hypothetical protein
MGRDSNIVAPQKTINNDVRNSLSRYDEKGEDIQLLVHAEGKMQGGPIYCPIILVNKNEADINKKNNTHFIFSNGKCTIE